MSKPCWLALLRTHTHTHTIENGSVSRGLWVSRLSYPISHSAPYRMLYLQRVFDLLRLGLFDLQLHQPARCAVTATAYCCLPPRPNPFSIAVAALHLFPLPPPLPSPPQDHLI